MSEEFKEIYELQDSQTTPLVDATEDKKDETQSGDSRQTEEHTNSWIKRRWKRILEVFFLSLFLSLLLVLYIAVPTTFYVLKPVIEVKLCLFCALTECFHFCSYMN